MCYLLSLRGSDVVCCNAIGCFNLVFVEHIVFVKNDVETWAKFSILYLGKGGISITGNNGKQI